MPKVSWCFCFSGDFQRVQHVCLHLRRERNMETTNEAVFSSYTTYTTETTGASAKQCQTSPRFLSFPFGFQKTIWDSVRAHLKGSGNMLPSSHGSSTLKQKIFHEVRGRVHPDGRLIWHGRQKWQLVKVTTPLATLDSDGVVFHWGALGLAWWHSIPWDDSLTRMKMGHLVLSLVSYPSYPTLMTFVLRFKRSPVCRVFYPLIRISKVLWGRILVDKSSQHTPHSLPQTFQTEKNKAYTMNTLHFNELSLGQKNRCETRLPLIPELL